MKRKMTIQTLIVAGLLILVTLLTGQMKPDAFDIGDFSDANLSALEEAFVQSQSNEELVLLIKALCWRYEVADDQSVKDKLLSYGQQLLDRAKAETIDLEYVDNPDHMLQILRLIRSLGAR